MSWYKQLLKEFYTRAVLRDIGRVIIGLFLVGTFLFTAIFFAGNLFTGYVWQALITLAVGFLLAPIWFKLMKFITEE